MFRSGGENVGTNDSREVLEKKLEEKCRKELLEKRIIKIYVIRIWEKFKI